MRGMLQRPSDQEHPEAGPDTRILVATARLPSLFCANHHSRIALLALHMKRNWRALLEFPLAMRGQGAVPKRRAIHANPGFAVDRRSRWQRVALCRCDLGKHQS